MKFKQNIAENNSNLFCSYDDFPESVDAKSTYKIKCKLKFDMIFKECWSDWENFELP